MHLEYTEFAKKYGPVFTVWLPKPYVVVADYENMKEAFGKNDDVNGRNNVFPDTALQLVPNQGIIFSEVRGYLSPEEDIVGSKLERPEEDVPSHLERFRNGKEHHGEYGKALEGCLTASV